MAKVYAGKDTVTHKALSPLRTLHQKLCGLTFIEPHVAPVASLIQTAINSIPAKAISPERTSSFCRVLSPCSAIRPQCCNTARAHRRAFPSGLMNALLANDVFTVCQQYAIPEEVPFVHVSKKHSANILNIGLW